MRGKDQNRQEDEKWMRQALSFAEQGKYHVSPNPLVGAVLVKHGEKIGEGFHEYFGGEHAEVRAIQNAEHEGHSVFESTLYVTLEPCSHSGKTPPCTDMILEKQIARVVFAASDPNPIAKGGGEVLRKKGVEITSGILEKEAEAQNRYFFHYWKQKRPFFLGKIALSQNGMVSNAVGEKTIISGTEALLHGHHLRAECDAVLVGIDTLLSDNPKLTVRHEIQGKNPLRIVLDPLGKCPKDANILLDNHFLICSTETGKQSLLKQDLSPERILVFPTRKFAPKEIALILFHKKITSILIEGGVKTLTSFFEDQLIDEFHLLRSEKMLSKTGIPFQNTPEQFGYVRTQRTPLGDSDVLEIWKPNL